MESVKLKYQKDGPALELDSAYTGERPDNYIIFF